MAAPREAEDRRLDSDASRRSGGRPGDLVALLAERRAAHGHQEGAGRSPEEIAERFLDQRAIPDAAVAARAAKIVGEYLGARCRAWRSAAGAPRIRRAP